MSAPSSRLPPGPLASRVAGWTAAVARVPGLPDVAVVGAADGSSAAALLAQLRARRPGADAAGGQAEATEPASPPAGVIVFPSGCGPAAPPTAGTRDQGGLEGVADVVLPPPGGNLPRGRGAPLHQLQSALALAGRDGGRSVLVVLPPWRDDGALACALAWYAAVGLIRGTAATEAIYGVRVNGLVVERGHEQLGAAMAGYLLSANSHWLNGYLLTADGLGAGVLSDERPRWQGHYPGAEFRLPAAIGRELGLHGS